MSFTAAAKEILQTKYTLSPDWGSDIFHTSVVRKQLTQHIPTFLIEMIDELDDALTDNIPLTDGTKMSRSSVCFGAFLFLTLTF